ncbi:hypothetical protein J1N35_041611 [Gossypium stocksii]|uniref:Uncharacterized protein n=1 Tax=Gossypium stocksii TaxID=47602 RepID=A0A9D3ZJJ3_9ROSI|nr:hypothetical protein J1N35_041611 [Gossypium stocksii]
MLPINYESWREMPDSNKNQALDNIKERFALEVSDDYIKKTLGISSSQKVGRLQLFDITHRKKDNSPMTSEAGEIMEKLKDKKVEYEAIASTNSSVNLEDIDNRIINEVLGPETYRWFDFKDLVFTRPNILDPSHSNTCLPGAKLKLKFRG